METPVPIKNDFISINSAVSAIGTPSIDLSNEGYFPNLVGVFVS